MYREVTEARKGPAGCWRHLGSELSQVLDREEAPSVRYELHHRLGDLALVERSAHAVEPSSTVVTGWQTVHIRLRGRLGLGQADEKPAEIRLYEAIPWLGRRPSMQ